jgi:hypothetical protein
MHLCAFIIYFFDYLQRFLVSVRRVNDRVKNGQSPEQRKANNPAQEWAEPADWLDASKVLK